MTMKPCCARSTRRATPVFTRMISGMSSGRSPVARSIAEAVARGVGSVLDVTVDVVEIEGLHIATEDNRVAVVETFVENLRRLPRVQGPTRVVPAERAGLQVLDWLASHGSGGAQR